MTTAKYQELKAARTLAYQMLKQAVRDDDAEAEATAEAEIDRLDAELADEKARERAPVTSLDGADWDNASEAMVSAQTELATIEQQIDKLRAKAKRIAAVYYAAREVVEAIQKAAKMTPAERAAMAHIINADSIESEETVH